MPVSSFAGTGLRGVRPNRPRGPGRCGTLPAWPDLHLVPGIFAPSPIRDETIATETPEPLCGIPQCGRSAALICDPEPPPVAFMLVLGVADAVPSSGAMDSEPARSGRGLANRGTVIRLDRRYAVRAEAAADAGDHRGYAMAEAGIRLAEVTAGWVQDVLHAALLCGNGKRVGSARICKPKTQLSNPRLSNPRPLATGRGH